jgi:hypothetical protein
MAGVAADVVVDVVGAVVDAVVVVVVDGCVTGDGAVVLGVVVTSAVGVFRLRPL